LGCHLIDYIVSLLGEPTKVHPFLKNTPELPETTINNTMAVLEYPHATACIRTCSRKVSDTNERHLRLAGTCGWCELEPLERFDGKPLVLRFYIKKAVCGFEPGHYTIEFPPQKDRYIVQLQELAEIIRGEAKSEYTYEHDYIVHKVSLAASGYEGLY
ncbi:MAG: hypothetical protein J6T46_12875, partial [Victivallales bacterium]|nr:hypothetical protein [Victivallales bacterium]